MADITKVMVVEFADIAKLGTITKSDVAKIGSIDTPAPGPTCTTYTWGYGDTGQAACENSERTTHYYDESTGKLYTDSCGGTIAADGFYSDGSVYYSYNADGLGGARSCGRSERRLKYNIEFIGDSPMGIPMYHFNYKDELHGKGRFVGTMADDLQRLGFGDSLFELNGEIWVDYHKLDVPFESVSV